MKKARNAPPIELLAYIYEKHLIPALIEQDMLEDHLVENLYTKQETVSKEPGKRKRKVQTDDCERDDKI